MSCKELVVGWHQCMLHYKIRSHPTQCITYSLLIRCVCGGDNTFLYQRQGELYRRYGGAALSLTMPFHSYKWRCNLMRSVSPAYGLRYEQKHTLLLDSALP